MHMHLLSNLQQSTIKFASLQDGGRHKNFKELPQNPNRKLTKPSGAIPASNLTDYIHEMLSNSGQ